MPAVIIRSNSVRVEVSSVDGVEESVGFSVLEASEEASKGVCGFVFMEDEEEEGVSVTTVMLVSSILVIRGVFLPSVVE